MWLGRVAAVVALTLVCVGVGVGVGAAHGAQGSRASAVIATVTPSPVGRIPSGFLGLSMEIRGVEDYTGSNASAINPVFEQLIRDLDPGQRPVLRLAGDSTDWSWYPIPHAARPIGVRYSLIPTWLQVMKALAEGVGARLIVGINLEVNSARVAAAEAKAIVAGIGSPWLEALELGNEPDLYHVLPWLELHDIPYYGRPADWDFSDYLSDYAAIRRALPNFPLAGPDVGAPTWVAGLGQFLSAEPRVRIATVHKYALGCLRTRATIAELFSDADTRDFAAGLGPTVRAAHAHGVSVRLDETNTVSCGGQAGVSNTFASALWSLDELFELARVGFDGVNVHTDQSTINQLFTFQRVNGVWEGRVAPDYYGLLAFAQAAPPGSTLLRVAGATSGPVHAWATRSPGGTRRVVLINFATSSARTVAVRAESASRPATLEWLEAPSAGATDDVMLGGQSFGSETSTGMPTGPLHTPSVGSSAGDYLVRMPAASAAILTLPQGDARAAPRAVGYAQAMSENLRIERGWIFVNGTRQDDGTIELGTGGEMRFSPFDAMSERQDAQITWGHILTASVQRLAFWRR